MKTEWDEQQAVNKLKDLLDKSAERLEPEIELRLRNIRRDALMPAEPERRWVPFRAWLATGSFAAVAMIIGISLWSGTFRQTLPVKPVDDVDIVASQEPLEVYEDLEFYRWLAKKELQGG